MHRLMLVAPGMADLPEDDWSGLLSGTWPLAERNSTVLRLAPLPEVGTPEAALLGMRPEEVHVAAGPLTVAALGASPPSRAVRLVATLLSVNESGLVQSLDAMSEEEVRELVDRIAPALPRRLHWVPGLASDHGLVWEDGSLDFRAMTPAEAVGQAWTDCMPDGDAAPLRTLIDDSLNILNDTDFNKQRADDGRPMLNLVWPWGAGFLPDLPNLAVMRGEPVTVRTDTLAVKGLARAVGYWPEKSRFHQGLMVAEARLAETARHHGTQIVHLDSIPEMVRHERAGLIAEQFARLDQVVLHPWRPASYRRLKTGGLGRR